MNKKYYSLVVALLVVIGSMNGQISVGDSNPDSTLDLNIPDSASPQFDDGILIPRVNNLSSTNPTITQDGMLVYLTEDDGDREKGFHYWIESYGQWVPFFTEWREATNGSGDDLMESRQATNGIYFKDENRLLGIGNDNPEETFEMRHEQVDNNIQIRSTGSPTEASVIYYTRSGTPASPGFLDPTTFSGDEDETIGYMTGKVYNGSGKSADIGNIRMHADGIQSAGDFPTKIMFSTTNDGNTADAGNRTLIINKDGDVGMGPDPDTGNEPDHVEPTAKLDINGDLSVKNLGNGFVPIYATANGTIYDGPRIIAAGKLDGSASIIDGKAYNVNTSVRNSTGNYTITINSAKPNYIVNLSTSNCTTCVIYYDYIDNTTFNVYINDITTGNPVNNQFMFSAIDFN